MFTETTHSLIGSVAKYGSVRTHTRGLTRWNSGPRSIARGPDGALWFTLWHGNVLGRMTTGGRVTLYRGLVTPSGGNEHDPDSILVPDGHGGYWFNESQGGRLAHLTFH